MAIELSLFKTTISVIVTTRSSAHNRSRVSASLLTYASFQTFSSRVSSRTSAESSALETSGAIRVRTRIQIARQNLESINPPNKASDSTRISILRSMIFSRTLDDNDRLVPSQRTERFL